MDIHQTVTDRIIAVLEAGRAGDWQCPWHRRGGSGLPINALTKRQYRGINVLSLWCAEQTAGYADGRWATYKQWSELGAQVRKGERSTLVVFYKDYEVTTNAEGDDGRRFVARASFAFNAEQVDGAPEVKPLPEGGYYPLPAMNDLAARTGATIVEGGEQACYVPALDEIRMPSRERFLTGHGWASTLAHELTHWTGAAPRLARDLSARFKSASYAAEELIAELGSAFLCAQLGLASEPHPQHATYIASWLRLLREDNRAIFTAAAKASEAVDFLTRERPG
jgi:antirestriction protein ArdC